MKLKYAVAFISVILIFALAGCGSAGSDDKRFVVRIEDGTVSGLYDIAANGFSGGEASGSKSGVKHTDNGITVFDFEYSASGLSEDLRLDLYAAGKSGEDYIRCGSVRLNSPECGKTYNIKISGDIVSGLSLSCDGTYDEKLMSIQSIKC